VRVSDVRNVSEALGNALVSFLGGMAVGELRKDESDESGPAYEVVITVRVLGHGASP
jgi:hypothetical protein